MGHFFGMILRSCRGTTTPSMFPNMDDRPRQNSMMKNSTDHSGDKGILVMASVKTMKASPVPSTPCRGGAVSQRNKVPQGPSQAPSFPDSAAAAEPHRVSRGLSRAVRRKNQNLCSRPCCIFKAELV